MSDTRVRLPGQAPAEPATFEPGASLPGAPWLCGWACLTFLATLVLMGLGAVVTNFKAGMADPAWPTSPAAVFTGTPEQKSDVRWVIEQTHRLAGYAVGVLAIVLCVLLWLRRPGSAACWLGTAALLGVIVQGLIGGFRVLEHDRYGLQLRVAHGMFAEVVLVLLAATALLTSRRWLAMAALPVSGRLRKLAAWTAGLAFLQIGLGVWLRHTYHPLAQRLHLLLAFAVTALIIWLFRVVWEGQPRRTPLRQAIMPLKLFLLLQIVLGVEVWMTQLSAGTIPEMLPVTGHRVAIRTAHVVVGALLFTSTVVIALLARHGMAAARQPDASGTRLGEAA